MKIYLKLYFSFLVIFFLTLIVALILASLLHQDHFRRELGSFLSSQAQFLASEYAEACGESKQAPQCARFLKDVSAIARLDVWITDRDGKVVLTRETGAPGFSRIELERAAKGEVVFAFRRRAVPRAIVPTSTGELMVLERRPRDVPPFPGLAFLIWIGVTAVTAAVLVWPLSLRITGPLRDLHRLGKEWAEGRLEQRAAVKGTDETAELAGVFNLMAGNLQRMLQQRKEFLALISHELKSPIARLQVASQMLLEKETTADRREILRGIQSDLEESERLVEQLLQLSRMEMSLSVFSPQHVDLAILLRKAVDQANASPRGVRVLLTMEAALPPVSGDPLLLERAVGNVLDNAVKFSPPAEEVAVSCVRKENRLIINISDRGPGISPEESEKIFEPFYRGKTPAMRDGTGLGLFITKRIMELHQGTITAAALAPSGTMFTMEFPL